MSEDIARIHPPDASISEEALKRAEEMIEKEEGVQNKFSGAMAAFTIWVAVAMSLFHLYASYAIVRTEVMRATHVAFVLFLSYLIFPIARRFRRASSSRSAASSPRTHASDSRQAASRESGCLGSCAIRLIANRRRLIPSRGEKSNLRRCAC